MTTIPLFGTYTFREATPEEFGPFFRDHRPRVFTDTITMPVESWISDESKVKLDALNDLIRDRVQLRYFIMDGDSIIGWHVGRQPEVEEYYMTNTAIFKEYQGKGIYTALLPRLLEIFRDQGFQKVTSHHILSNNAVIVPKLKAGFHITGFKVDERFGVLVTLSYIFDEKRRRAYEFRTGQARPDEDIRCSLSC
jgi:GNAT superfamily N-acetyltransferase